MESGATKQQSMEVRVVGGWEQEGAMRCTGREGGGVLAKQLSCCNLNFAAVRWPIDTKLLSSRQHLQLLHSVCSMLNAHRGAKQPEGAGRPLA